MIRTLNKKTKNTSSGLSLVEVIVGAAIIGTSVISIVGIYGGLTKLSYRNTPRVQAAMLAEEGTEALKTMRDSGWTSQIASLTVGSTYRLAWTGGSWKATTSSALIDNAFDRTFVLSDVNRDSVTFNVVTSGGVLDTSTKKATVTVAWRDDGATTTKSLETYLFNTFSN